MTYNNTREEAKRMLFVTSNHRLDTMTPCQALLNTSPSIYTATVNQACRNIRTKPCVRCVYREQATNIRAKLSSRVKRSCHDRVQTHSRDLVSTLLCIIMIRTAMYIKNGSKKLVLEVPDLSKQPSRPRLRRPSETASQYCSRRHPGRSLLLVVVVVKVMRTHFQDRVNGFPKESSHLGRCLVGS